MAVAESRWRRWSGIALLGLVPLLASCGSSSPANVPQPLHVAQSSYGPKSGMQLVGSPSQVYISLGGLASPGNREQLSQVTFNLRITNTGTVPYDCSVIRALEIPKTVDIVSGNGAPDQADLCAGVHAGHTIAPGSKASLSFFLANIGHPPKEIVVLPYGSDVGRMVWSVADCPIFPPKTCFGPREKLYS